MILPHQEQEKALKSLLIFCHIKLKNSGNTFLVSVEQNITTVEVSSIKILAYLDHKCAVLVKQENKFKGLKAYSVRSRESSASLLIDHYNPSHHSGSLH